MSAYLGDRSTIIDVNTTKSIVAVVVLAVIGPCMFILQPAYVQGLVEYMNFSEEQAGLIAAAEMFGLAATAIAVNFFLGSINWRLMSAVFLAIATIGNGLSLTVSDASSLMAIRFVTGLGSGGLISITFTMMGLTKRAHRNMGFIIASVLTYGAFGLLVMPSVFQMVGVAGLLAFFGLFSASGFLFLANLPCSDQTHEHTVSSGIEYPWSTKLMVLSAVLAYNLAIGIVWVYIFLVGVEAGISEQWVANALTISQFLGIAGAMMAVLFELRFGRILPLMVGIVGGALGIALILGSPTALMYGLGVCAFNFLWNLTMPYLLAALAGFDPTGRVVAMGIALQMLGYAVGPALAASLLEANGYDFINSIAIGLFVAAAVLLIPGLRAQNKAEAALVAA
jgi:MFS family permease